ncbi:phosphate uptake regulator PhoU [Candidatus Woesearchaeota archaeon]|nr:phosphate uptake regulator PhoU [Candidatus Woesearchaeota archaeon]
MEYRRLIKFGNSSFVVSVPKDWLRKNHLEKGDMVYVSENGSNELVIVPNLPQQERELKEVTINIDTKPIKRIKRELISAYLKDFSIVTLTGKDLEKQAGDIRNIIQNLMALEIIEQTKDKIVTQDFLNLREVSLSDLIRKMDIITRAMLSDLSLCLEKNLGSNMTHREMDVNKMSYVILRVVRRGLSDPEYAKTLRISPLQLFELWNIGSQLELVADQADELAQEISINQLTQEQKTFVKSILERIEAMYLQVMKAFYTSDLGVAYEVSALKSEVAQLCRQERKSSSLLHKQKAVDPHYSCIIERLIALGKEVNSIARRVYS